MKKKNGFIATSLIYSFFLIFITLFLTIVADYLQDRVLLNTIEDGIKTDLNNQMTINDFELGDYIYFNSISDDLFVVAKIEQAEKKLVLYHDTLKVIDSEVPSTLLNDINDDILFSIDDTTLNKIIGDNCTVTRDSNSFRNFSCGEKNRYRVIWELSNSVNKLVGNGSYKDPFTFGE